MEDIYALSDLQIQKKIGEKLKATRLRLNITQDSVAEASAISRSSVKKVESGEIGSFDTFLRILRTLGMLDEIAKLCEEDELQPRRKRAVGVIKNNKEDSEW